VNALFEGLKQAAAHLDSLGSTRALVGGLAVSARAMPRTTRDVDVAVAVESDAAAGAFVFALTQRGYQSVTVVEQRATGRLATARLRVPGTSRLLLDTLFASSGIEPEIARSAEALEILPGSSFRSRASVTCWP